MRFTRTIGTTLTVGAAALIGAAEKARDSFAKAHEASLPKPPDPDLATLAGWIAGFNDPLALSFATLTAVTTGYSVWQMFKPDPATNTDVKKDGRKTREGVEHLSGQVAAEGQASEARDAVTHRLIAGDLSERAVAAIDSDSMTPEQIARIMAAATKKLGPEAAPAATQYIIEAAARSSDEVQELLAAGKFAEAGEAQRVRAEAGDARQAQQWRDTARIFVLTSITKAISAYARAVELDPGDFGTRIELSRLHRAAGSLPEARRTAEAALQRVGDDWDRMVAEGELGQLALAEGNLPQATQHFRAAMNASQALVDADPDILHLQRQLSVLHNKLGDVALAAGDLAAARAAYGEGLAIAERLAWSDPGNAGWQRDLSVSHNKLGDVAVAQRDLAAARAAYGESLAIFDRLARSDPGNAEWQRDLSVSHERLGDVAEAAGDIGEAVRCYEASLPIARQLAESWPDHPGFVNDLAITQRRLAALRARLRGD